MPKASADGRAIVNAAAGQVTGNAAEIYDAFFVPALFREWTARTLAPLALVPGQRMLDVACGTGIVAIEARNRIMPTGSVTGLDRNEGMLAVARGNEPAIDWTFGDAEALPFADSHFNAVACQFGLMFFENRVAALEEMWRVLRPGGRLAVTVWDKAENSPGYAAMITLLDRLFGADVANALRAPFVLGDTAEIRALFEQAGIEDVAIDTLQGMARFPSLQSWVHTDIKGWTLADMIDKEQYEVLQKAATTELAAFAAPDGTASFAAPAHIAVVRKSATSG